MCKYVHVHVGVLACSAKEQLGTDLVCDYFHPPNMQPYVAQLLRDYIVILLLPLPGEMQIENLKTLAAYS